MEYMAATPNNGVPVRDVHVLIRTADRRVNWIMSLVFFALGTADAAEDVWYVVSVHRSGVVAERRFSRRNAAETARSRFVERVTTMPPDKYELADLQAVLDAV